MHPVTEGLDELDTHAGDVDASDVLPSLGPAHEALALAAWVSEGGYLGWCNSPLRDDAACVPVGALRSPVTGECVNLVQHPFEAALAGSSCVQPSGGQRVCGTHTHIKVSYILTLHDNDALAARALLELFKTAQEVESVEFVVYDDASASVPARVVVTLSRLRSLFGACVVFVRERGEARGFGAANDAAIRAARGELIVLVNTDMYVTPGWLAALTSTLKSTPRAAMAGPLYIGKDNVITEAGGIVFGDANAANYGRYSAPAHDTLYARRVDYISAACLLMRRDTYFDLGGFDPRYERGYYEDTDLALAAANASLLVMYQPGAIVYHQEGSTLGTDESPLKQRLMVENKQKFVDKWDFLLKLKHEYLPYPDAGFVDAAVQRYPELMLWVRDTVNFGLLEAVPPEGADAQAEYDAMAAAIREVATNHLAPRGSRRRRGWQFTLSQRTLRLMDARQRAHSAWLRSKSAAAKRERNRANRAADAAVQRDRERWIGQQVAEAQDMLRKKNLRQFARACDRLAGRSRSHQIPPAMRDVSGALHSGPDGVLKAMTESFDKLYGGETKLSDETLNQLENDVAAFELTRATEVDEAHGRPPDLAETEACLPAPLLGVGAARAAALQRALLSIEFHVTIIPSRESDAAALATQARILGADVLEPRPFESADFAPRAGQMIAACRFALLVLSYDAPPAPPPDSANGDNALGSSGGGAAGDAAAARATATRARTLRASCPGMPLILDAPRLRCVARALAHVRPPIPVASVAPMLWRVRSSRAPPAAAALALTAALLPSLPPAGGAAPTSTFARRALGWWAGPAAALPPGLAELCGAELDLLGEVSLALVGSELEREVVVRLRPSLISRVLAVPLADAAAALAPGMLEAEDLGAGGDGETLGTAGTRGAGGRDTHAAGGGSPCAARPLAVLLLASSRAAAEFVTRDVMPVVWGLMLASERAAFSLHIAGYAVEEALSAREGSDEWSARVLMHEPSAAVGQGYMAGVVAGVRLVAAPLLPDDEGVPDSAVAAMASGLPLVTTSLGGHLLGARNGTHAAVTDTPTAFAYALLEVLRCGTGVWDTLAAGGPLLVEPSLSQDATLASHVLEQI
ncbi:hypothetical protein FOA52_006268 [Chlamydomonas sp. UWO 241]|nr:hypothetical protein FOA52_006268 [Chlamydomonas sp. UWO 241]